MSNALTKAQQSSVPALQIDEAELIQVLQSSLYPGAALSSIKLVLSYCKASGLDPMQKPVHIVPMWDSKAKQMRDVIMPGVGLYRTNAARTNELAGVSEPEFGPTVRVASIDVPEWCRVTVKRITQGAERSFTAVEYWAENYATAGKDSIEPNAMWRKRPRGQLAKCAQAQALRMAFPEATGNQPTADEMEGKEIDLGAATVVEQPAEQTLPAYPEDKFAQMLPTWEKLVKEGKKTADAIGATLSAKHRLTEEQAKQIRNLGKSADAIAAESNVIDGSIEELATPEQIADIRKDAYELALSDGDICAEFSIETLDKLPARLLADVRKFISGE